MLFVDGMAFNVSNCKMGDGGFVQISSSIHYVERLYIGCNNDNHLTLTGIAALSEVLRKLFAPNHWLLDFFKKQAQSIIWAIGV